MSIKAPKDSWAIQPRGTACVIVDVQRAFVDDGAPYKCVGAQAIIPKINELTSLCRRQNIPIIFIKANRRPDGSDSGLMDDMAPSHPNDDLEPLAGKRGSEFCDGLNVEKADFIVPKVRYSAFIPGSSQLETLLRGMNIDSIIICGVATDVCVGINTMEAMMLGFRVFFVGDLCATYTEERHRIALQAYNMHFAKVTTLDKVKNMLS